MSNLETRAREIFGEVLDSPGDTVAFVEEACGEDQELQRQVAALLNAHREAGEFLPASHRRERTSDFPWMISSEDSPAREIGPYILTEEVGRGGMGSVWRAEQSHPLQRTVAIKFIKSGMDSARALARFDCERRALAMMDHINIARVVDGGLTDGGRPYIAMEFVEGTPLTEYCDAAQLSIRERLELFLPICHAVQHAHQKGIIHRDIKPSNILVCLYDGKPIPKVIDFGLAKATYHTPTDGEASVNSVVVGTPLYMSPEQAVLNNSDIDTRADIYALGVVLYELLTGTTPLAKADLKEVGYEEVLRRIQHIEPIKPSVRLRDTAERLRLAASRSTDVDRLIKSVTGDVDWVIMRALEKERSRRYETADAFAEDIRRHLVDEPVSAGPPTLRYRAHKFVKRNRTGVLAAGITATALAIGIIGITTGMLWALTERNVAIDARRAESTAKSEAIAAANAERLAKLEAEASRKEFEASEKRERQAKQIALQRLSQITKANEILSSIFASLDYREIDSGQRPLRAILAAKLNRAVEQLEGDSIGDRLVVARLQNQFGLSLLALGEPEIAIELLRKSQTTRIEMLGQDHADTLSSRNNLAMALKHDGQLEEAATILQKTLELYQSKFGSDSPEVTRSMNNLATTYQSLGKLEMALPLFEKALTIRTNKLGPESLDTVLSMNNLAGAYRSAGEPTKALPLRLKTYELLKNKLGPEHPHTLVSMSNLALAYQDAGRFTESLAMHEESVKCLRSTLGSSHPFTCASMSNLASAYQRAGDFDKALPLHEETVSLNKSARGTDHPDTLKSMANLGTAYHAMGRFEEAEAILRTTLEIRSSRLGADHPDTLVSMSNLAAALRELGDLEQALTLLEDTVTLRKAKIGTQHPQTLKSMAHLAKTYLLAGRRKDAIDVTFVRLKSVRSSLPDESFQQAIQLLSISNFLIDAEAYQDSELLLREVSSWDESTGIPTWLRLNVRSLLGEAMTHQQEFKEAEALLLEAHQGMASVVAESAINLQVQRKETNERLYQLYKAQGMKDEAEYWRLKTLPGSR